MVSDMFMSPASPSGLCLFRCFRNRSLHSSIRNFLLPCGSAVMFRELKLVQGMQAGRAALGGGFAPQDGHLEKLSV